MSRAQQSRSNDEGYLLLGLVVVCFLLVLALSVAAPRVAKQLERDREVESEHRAQEYVRAIQLYYRRTHRFPSSVDELLGSGTTGISSALNVKYLRQQYKDPLTRDEYRLIKVGTAKTEVKGFFGEPLQGAAVGLGAAAGLQSNPGGTGASAIGGSTPGTAVNGSSSGFSLGGSAFGGSSTSAGTNPAGLSSAGSATASTSSSGPSTNGSSFGSGTDATTFQGSKAAFLGVGSNAKGHGLVEWNGSENIEDWEFLYDPRVELLKAKVSIFGGSPAASGNGSFSTLPSATSPSIFAPAPTTGSTGTTNSTGAPSTPTSPAGTSTTPQP